MTNALEVRSATVIYRSGRHRFAAVEGVSVDIPKGGTLGIIGESGSGKSTLLRAVCGLVPMAEGAIFIDSVDYTTRRARSSAAFRRSLQMVFQDPYASLNPRMSVRDVMAEALAQRGVARSIRVAETARVLDLVGISMRSLDSFPHEFSGGQRQRIAIARALALEPEILLMDEVTSALDVSVQGMILGLLTELQDQLGLSYLMVSHDISVISAMSDLVAVMYMGQVVEAGPADEILSSPGHPYTRVLVDSVPRVGHAPVGSLLIGEPPDPRQPPAGCRFHTRCPVGPRAIPDRAVCMDLDPTASAEGRRHRAACHFADPIEGRL